MSKRTPFSFSMMNPISAYRFIDKLQKLIDLLYWFDNELSASETLEPISIDGDTYARELIHHLDINRKTISDLAYKISWYRNIVMVSTIEMHAWEKLIANIKADVKDGLASGKCPIWWLEADIAETPEDYEKYREKFNKEEFFINDLLTLTKEELAKLMGIHKYQLNRAEEDLNYIGLSFSKKEQTNG